MFGVGLFTGLTIGIIFGLCIYAWVESPRKIKVGTPSTSNNSESKPCNCTTVPLVLSEKCRCPRCNRVWVQ